MITAIESNVWCDLVSQWIVKNSVEALDAIERARLPQHAAQCQACAGLLRHLSTSEPDAENPSSEWPHLSDETLRLIIHDQLSASEEELFKHSIEPHLQTCDYCADRLAVLEELPDITESHDAVVGRGTTVPLHWRGNRAEVSWILDQAAAGLGVWSVSLTHLNDELEAKLSVRGEMPEAWRFSLPLATDKQLLPTLVFNSESRYLRYTCQASVNDKWQATPILTMSLPKWTQLVSIGEDPATMVSLDDARRKELSLRVPYDGPPEFDAIASRLDKLLVDLRGESLELQRSPSNEKSILIGQVFTKSGREVGRWMIDFTEDRIMSLAVSALNGEIIRFATHDFDDAPFLQTPKEVSEEKILIFDPARSRKRRIARASAIGLAAGASSQAPLEEGRRFLVRGRHEFALAEEEREAVVEVEERDSKLWVRFLRGNHLCIARTSEPLGNSMKLIEPIEDASLLDILQESLEWCE